MAVAMRGRESEEAVGAVVAQGAELRRVLRPRGCVLESGVTSRMVVQPR